jgi:hypothetical protein
MGAGRKTFTYDHDTRNESNYRFEQQQKNLGNQLGGVIFSERRWRCAQCRRCGEPRRAGCNTRLAAHPPPRAALTLPCAG